MKKKESIWVYKHKTGNGNCSRTLRIGGSPFKPEIIGVLGFHGICRYVDFKRINPNIFTNSSLVVVVPNRNNSQARNNANFILHYWYLSSYFTPYFNISALPYFNINELMQNLHHSCGFTLFPFYLKKNTKVIRIWNFESWDSCWIPHCNRPTIYL